MHPIERRDSKDKVAQGGGLIGLIKCDGGICKDRSAGEAEQAVLTILSEVGRTLADGRQFNLRVYDAGICRVPAVGCRHST